MEAENQITIRTNNLSLRYGDFQALTNINLEIDAKKITSIIGPSGCGKSTLLRVFNRMNDLIDDCQVTGQTLIDGQDIYLPDTDLIALRKKVGMVFQRPNPFPLSIYENIVFSLKIHEQKKKRHELDHFVESSLKEVMLWDKLNNKLHSSALELSLEQQQRLCIARLLPVKPDILLMDEPCSTLDPAATQKIEELMQALKQDYTIVIVTHNMQQAARVSEETGFMFLGELVEYGKTSKIFTSPKKKRTEDYITGRFG